MALSKGTTDILKALGYAVGGLAVFNLIVMRGQVTGLKEDLSKCEQALIEKRLEIHGLQLDIKALRAAAGSEQRWLNR